MLDLLNGPFSPSAQLEELEKLHSVRMLYKCFGELCYTIFPSRYDPELSACLARWFRTLRDVPG